MIQDACQSPLCASVLPQVDFNDHITFTCCNGYRQLLTCQNEGNGDRLAISASLDLTAKDGLVIGRYQILVPEDADHLLFVSPPNYWKLRDTEVAHDLQGFHAWRNKSSEP